MQKQNNDLSTSEFAPPLKSYLHTIGEIPRLTHEEMLLLVAEAQDGNQHAFNKVVEANLRLVVRFAKKRRGQGLPFEDLIEEGNLGLMKAVEKYDITSGYQFSTYAVWWIREAIDQAIITQARVIRVPKHQIKNMRTVKREEYHLGRSLSSSEIMNLLNTTEEATMLIMQYMQNPLSFDTPYGSGPECKLTPECIIPSGEDGPEEMVQYMDMHKMVIELTDMLSEQERDIIFHRYGLTEFLTLKALGERYGVHMERIRQIEQKALSTLKKKCKRIPSVGLL